MLVSITGTAPPFPLCPCLTSGRMRVSITGTAPPFPPRPCLTSGRMLVSMAMATGVSPREGNALAAAPGGRGTWGACMRARDSSSAGGASSWEATQSEGRGEGRDSSGEQAARCV